MILENYTVLLDYKTAFIEINKSLEIMASRSQHVIIPL